MRKIVLSFILAMLLFVSLAYAVDENIFLSNYYTSTTGDFAGLKTSGNTYLAETSGNVSIGTGSTQVTINGVLTVIGNLTVNSGSTYNLSKCPTSCSTPSSDLRFKKDIKTLENPLLRLAGVKGVTYQWRGNQFPERGFPRGKEIGFIAQDFEQEFPELVGVDNQRYKNLDYAKITAILLEVIKGQQKEIEGLKQSIKEFEEEGEGNV